jgi:type I site-specific restriction endonuclease
MTLRNVFMAVVIGLLFAGMAGAWGLPVSLPGSGSSGADPDDFLRRAQSAEELTGRSADLLFKAVASKEEQEKMEELQKKLNETTDDKEKNALRHQITESEMATIEKRAADKELQQEAKKWDEKKKKQVSVAMYNLGLGSLQAALLVPEGMRIANSIRSNPVNAVRLAIKLNSVVDALSALNGTISNTAKVTSAMKPLMSAAKIESKAPTSAADTPKDTEL